jgi:hypothetical protein
MLEMIESVDVALEAVLKSFSFMLLRNLLLAEVAPGDLQQHQSTPEMKKKPEKKIKRTEIWRLIFHSSQTHNATSGNSKPFDAAPLGSRSDSGA